MATYDSYGDGWQGNAFRLTNVNGEVTSSGPGTAADVSTTTECFDEIAAPYTLTLDFSSGSWPSEISWDLCGSVFHGNEGTNPVTISWSEIESAWAIDPGGTAAEDAVTTVTPTPAPTTTHVPTVSILPSLPPTDPAELRVIDVATFAELKSAVESAPGCPLARVRVQLLSEVRMRSSDTAVQIPAESCVDVVGVPEASRACPAPTSTSTVSPVPTGRDTATSTIVPSPVPDMCANGTSPLRISMSDTHGDGWQGAWWRLQSADGDVAFNGTLIDGARNVTFICLTDGCYSFEVTSGTWDHEIGFALMNGALSGGAPFALEYFHWSKEGGVATECAPTQAPSASRKPSIAPTSSPTNSKAPSYSATDVPTANPTAPPTFAAARGCSDIDGGAADPYGDGCAAYYGHFSWCGNYDDSDFSSNEMCCECGGGQQAETSWNPTSSPNPSSPPTQRPTFAFYGQTPESDVVQIIGNGDDRIFQADVEFTRFSLSNLLLARGYSETAGGAIGVLAGCGQLELTNCVMQSNHAGSSEYVSSVGGAMAVINGGLVVLRNVSFLHNWACAGGALYVSKGAHVQATDTLFRRNDAFGLTGDSGSGGAVDAYIDCELEFSKSRFENNTAMFLGGGLHIYATSRAKLFNVTTHGNFNTRGDGGAVFVQNGGVEVRDSEFYGDRTAGSGGAVFASNDVDVVLENVRFVNGAAGQNGGGLFFKGQDIYPATMTAKRLVFLGCTADASGGALYMYGQSTGSSIVDITGVIFDSNDAKVNGGAVQLDGTSLNLTNAAFRHNDAMHCGAMDVHGSTSRFQNITFYGNLARGHGGALCVGNEASPAHLTVHGLRFEKNWAEFGGAVKVDDASNVSTAQTVFKHNDASEDGGAIWCAGAAAVVLNHETQLQQNNAGGNGGAVELGEEGATLRTLGNVAFYQNAALGHGGAIHAGLGTAIEITAGCRPITFTARPSDGEDWAAINDTTLQIIAVQEHDPSSVLKECCSDAFGTSTATHFDGNTVLAAAESGSFQVEYCLRPGTYITDVSHPWGGDYGKRILLSAMASESGEAIFNQVVDRTYFEVVFETDKTVQFGENAAGGDGGGIWLGEDSILRTVRLSAVAKVAAGNGGFVHATQGWIEAVDVSLSQNIAGNDGGAVSLSLFAHASLGKARVRRNTAGRNGGAVSVATFSRLSAKHSTFSDNKATVHGGACSFENTKASSSSFVNCTLLRSSALTGNGGGLSIVNSALELEATRLLENKALSGHGGALASTEQKSTSATRTTIVRPSECTEVEIEIDWLSNRGSCAEEIQRGGISWSCDRFSQLTDSTYHTCHQLYHSATESAYLPSSTRGNCTGCSCNAALPVILDGQLVASPETYATIVDSELDWDGWSFHDGRDFNGKTMAVFARAQALSRETFCLSPGNYTFAAFDISTLPHDKPWWGGKYRLVVDGQPVAYSGLSTRRAMHNFTVTQNGKRGVQMMHNKAPLGGGGAVFWDEAVPANLDMATVQNCTALYGPATATDARSVALISKANTTTVVTSGQPMGRPLSVEMLDFYGQRVRSDGISTVLAEAASANAQRPVTLSGVTAMCQGGAASFDDLIIELEPNASASVTFSVPTLTDVAPAHALIEFRECPAGLVEDATTGGNVVCVLCDVKSYETEGRCIRCIEGMECDKAGQSLDEVILLPGYWRAGLTSSRVYRCSLGAVACPGDNKNTCMQNNGYCACGYGGPLCQECQESYFPAWSDSRCYACDRTRHHGSSAIVGSLILVIVVGLIVSAGKLAIDRYASAQYMFRAGKAFVKRMAKVRPLLSSQRN